MAGEELAEEKDVGLRSPMGLPVKFLDDIKANVGQQRYGQYDAESKQIQINRKEWDSLTEEGRQDVLHHEDGHHVWEGLDADEKDYVMKAWRETPPASGNSRAALKEPASPSPETPPHRKTLRDQYEKIGSALTLQDSEDDTTPPSPKQLGSTSVVRRKGEQQP